MGDADSTARSNFAARARRRKKSPELGRSEKGICSPNGSSDYAELRSPQHRWRRGGAFAQTNHRAFGGSEKIVAKDGGEDRRPTIRRLRGASPYRSLAVRSAALSLIEIMHENT